MKRGRLLWLLGGEDKTRRFAVKEEEEEESANHVGAGDGEAAGIGKDTYRGARDG